MLVCDVSTHVLLILFVEIFDFLSWTFSVLGFKQDRKH